MCQFWITRFPCGCVTWRNSGYEFCVHRDGEGCVVILETFLWNTFCPGSRKTFKGKKTYDAGRLRSCCKGLEAEELARLCLKCDSLPKPDNESGPIRWACPGHVTSTSRKASKDAPAVFEEAVKLWPADLMARYYRRKNDGKAKDCGWSV